jgi:hypothetical protein
MPVSGRLVGSAALSIDLTTREQQGQRLIERLAVGDESRINQLTTRGIAS